MKNLLVGAIVVLSSTFSAASANAFVIDFGTDAGVGGFNISEAARTSIGAALTVEVVESTTAGAIDFIFSNSDAVYDSSVTDIYFGKAPTFGDVFSFKAFETTGVVAFSEGASPSDPPPGSSTFASFSADSDAPVALKGIGYGEGLTVRFDLLAPVWSFAEIEEAFLDGSFQIITHVQSIDGGEGGKSQYFVSNPPLLTVGVTGPSSLALLGLGLAGLSLSRRKVALRQ